MGGGLMQLVGLRQPRCLSHRKSTNNFFGKLYTDVIPILH